VFKTKKAYFPKKAGFRFSAILRQEKIQLFLQGFLASGFPTHFAFPNFHLDEIKWLK
jgi:hypothetical protein